jgi:hypothetical protein
MKPSEAVRGVRLLTVLMGVLGLAVSAAAQQRTLPAPWQFADVGAVGTPGYAYQGPDGDLYIAGAGSDIWGRADSFAFAYQPILDGQIWAPNGLTERAVDPFAKIGVMIRQTLDPGSPHVILDLKPDGGIEFMTRSSADQETEFVAGTTIPVNTYARLRLTRADGIVTGEGGTTSLRQR